MGVLERHLLDLLSAKVVEQTPDDPGKDLTKLLPVLRLAEYLPTVGQRQVQRTRLFSV